MACQPVGFDHEGLDAYRLAIDALSLAAGMTRGLP